jgi:predicted ABC-type ATPase
MFAGPNGSGKSTLKTVLRDELIGFYLNPDEIEQTIHSDGHLDFADYGLAVQQDEIAGCLEESSLLKSQGIADLAQGIQLADNRLSVVQASVNSYLASTLTEFLRHKLLEARASFTFETVMSHHSKVDFLATAQQAGFRTYLYYVATADPAINISRVHNRVVLGGHDVPDDKVESRYYRSLDLLYDAIRNSNRAYIFDNSGSSGPENKTWLAEITDGKHLELKVDRVPAWFKKYVLDKAGAV